MTPTSPTQTAMIQLLPLAKDLDENKVTPGVLGFIVFAAIGIATWMLMKSMNRHMKKVDFEERPRGAGDGGVPTAATAPSSSPAPGDGERPGPGV